MTKDVKKSDNLFKKMISEYDQDLFENDHAPLSPLEKMNIRCFFDFIEEKYMAVEPVDAEVQEAVRGGQYAFDCVVQKDNALMNQTVIVRADHLQTLIIAAISHKSCEDEIAERINAKWQNLIEDYKAYSYTLRLSGEALFKGLDGVVKYFNNTEAHNIEEIAEARKILSEHRKNMGVK